MGEDSGADIRIVDGAGNSFTVDIGGARTVGDVLARINGASGNPGTVTASAAGGESRIRLADSSGGTGSLQVESINGGFAAENLGIAGEAAAPGGEIVGGDLRPAGAQAESIFTALIALRDALANDDKATMSLAGKNLEAASARLLDARAEVGARVQRLERTQSRLEDQRVELEKLVTEDRGADIAESVTDLQWQQTVLQATYSVTGKVLSMSLMDFLR